MQSCPWWHHDMEPFSALLGTCEEIHRPPVDSPHKEPVMRTFDILYYVRLNKYLDKQSISWWFETSQWVRWRFKSPASRLYTQLFIQGADQRKTSKLRVIGLCRGIHRSPVNSSHKRPVTRKMFLFDDIIMALKADRKPLDNSRVTKK